MEKKNIPMQNDCHAGTWHPEIKKYHKNSGQCKPEMAEESSSSSQETGPGQDI